MSCAPSGAIPTVYTTPDRCERRNHPPEREEIPPDGNLPWTVGLLSMGELGYQVRKPWLAHRGVGGRTDEASAMSIPSHPATIELASQREPEETL